jgi:hypothetical protein
MPKLVGQCLDDRFNRNKETSVLPASNITSHGHNGGRNKPDATQINSIGAHQIPRAWTLVAGDTAAVEVGPETLRERARRLAENSRAANTRKAYASDMDQFRTWCATQHPPLQALPAQSFTVALYLTALAEVRKPATIRRRMNSISVVHQLAGPPHPSPTRRCRRYGRASGAPKAAHRPRPRVG